MLTNIVGQTVTLRNRCKKTALIQRKGEQNANVQMIDRIIQILRNCTKYQKPSSEQT